MTFARIVVFFLLVLPMCSPAFFPPASKSTSGEMLEYRRRKKIEYKDARLDYEKQLVDSRIQVEARFAAVPWTSRPNQAVPSWVPIHSAEKSWKTVQKNIVGLTFMTLIPVALVAFVLLRKMMAPDHRR